MLAVFLYQHLLFGCFIIAAVLDLWSLWRLITQKCSGYYFCLSLIFHFCLCVGGGAEADWCFSAEETGLIFRFHRRPFLVPQAAMKVVLTEGWYFWTTLGSDWSVGQSHGHWAGGTPSCVGGRLRRGGKHPVPSTELLLPWLEREARNSKKTFNICVLVKAFSGPNTAYSMLSSDLSCCVYV